MQTEDQSIILRIFAGLHARPGQFVPVKTLFLNWPPSFSNAAFADAVEGLAASGGLHSSADATAYALPELVTPKT